MYNWQGEFEELYPDTETLEEKVQKMLYLPTIGL